MHFNNHSGKTWDASRGNVASPVDPAGNMAQDKAIPDRIHLRIQEGLTAADRKPWTGTCSRYNLQVQVRTSGRRDQKLRQPSSNPPPL